MKILTASDPPLVARTPDPDLLPPEWCFVPLECRDPWSRLSSRDQNAGMARTLGYHYVKSAYGLRLPGDERGSWSATWDEEIGFVEPHVLHPGAPVRLRMAEERMKHPPVRLTETMLEAVADTHSSPLQLPPCKAATRGRGGDSKRTDLARKSRDHWSRLSTGQWSRR